MDTFRLLHVSDLHMGVRARVVGFPDSLSMQPYPAGTPALLAPSSYDPHLTDAAARWMYRHAGLYDVILVTGDLATSGNPADLRVASGYLFDPVNIGYLSQAGTATLQAAGTPIYILPGNHDRFDGWYLGPGGVEFDAVFGQTCWAAGQGAQTLVVLQAANCERLALIGADFTLLSYRHANGLFGYLGQGRVYQTILTALAQATQLVRQAHGADLAVVWAVHFPPDFAGIDPNLSLLDQHLLVTAASACDVHHVFCGHTHEPREYPASDPQVTVHCAGTATQYVTQHGNVFHDLEIDVAAGVATATRRTDIVWNQAAGDFV